MLTLANDGSTSQTRFLAMAAEDIEGGDAGDTTWTIPAAVAWEGGGELKVMLGGGGTAGEEDDGDRKLMEKVQELEKAGKWFKVRP